MADNDINIKSTKIRLFSIAFLGVFFLIGTFLFRWQIVDAKKFEDMAKERIRNVEIPALRGSIYAQDGSTLAYSERTFDIYAYIPEIERAEKYGKQTRNEYLDKVSKTLETDRKELEDLINSGPWWIKIASSISKAKKDVLVALKRDDGSDLPLEGNFIEYTSERKYPEKELSSHIIGFYGFNDLKSDWEGGAGIELKWEKSLKSFKGFQLQQVDSFGNTITISDFTPIEEQRGSDIYLTIDLRLQRIVEQNLKTNVERYGAQAGASVLMDPKTGRIMALANYPTYDPNIYNKVKDPEAFSNRAVTVPYEFGSIGKIFTVAGAIEDKLVTPDTVILENGHKGCEFFIDKNERQCQQNPANCQVCTFDKKAQPKMTVGEALVKSDNIGLYHTAQKLEIKGLYKYLDAFKMGYPSGIEMNESQGYLKDESQWNISDLVTYSYGHGYDATLVEVTSSVAAMANDGKMMQPFIVDKVVESDGNIIKTVPRVIAQPISKETANIVNNVLTQVYKNNVFDYWNKDLLNYNIAMKSGTALIPYRDRAGYSDEINATYVGYDISDEKSFILTTWLHKPKSGGLSSQNARTLWLDTFRGIKDYIGVPKNK